VRTVTITNRTSKRMRTMRRVSHSTVRVSLYYANLFRCARGVSDQSQRWMP
jgi:hypothetical protein